MRIFITSLIILMLCGCATLSNHQEPSLKSAKCPQLNCDVNMQSHIQIEKNFVLATMPVENAQITSIYGLRQKSFSSTQMRMHEGFDYAAPVGTPVTAGGDGKVIWAAWQSGYGKTIMIDHGNGYYTRYAHLDQYTVKKNDDVYMGDEIGKLGKTGNASGPHLHYELLQGEFSTSKKKFGLKAIDFPTLSKSRFKIRKNAS